MGISPAASNIDDDAAEALWRLLVEADRSLAALGNEAFTQGWHEAVRRVAESDTAHPLVGGYAHRLLYDVTKIPFEELSRTFTRYLSPGNPPTAAAARACCPAAARS